MCGQCGGDSDSEYDDPSEVNREAIEAYLTGGSKAVAIGTLATPVERAYKEGSVPTEKALSLLQSDFFEMAGVIPQDDVVRHQRLLELVVELSNREGTAEQKSIWMNVQSWNLNALSEKSS